MIALETIVSPLFVPANRPERFIKAATSGADAIILDLEDAVPADAKDAARAALDTGFTDLPVIVRVNAVGTPWHEDDLAAAARLPFAGIMLPKSERVADLAVVRNIHPVLALVETVKGVAAAKELAESAQAARLAFGSVDYSSDLGCAHNREALAHARSVLVFASRLGGLPAPLDGVTTEIADPDAALSDARHARMIGFGGKLVIHPKQISSVREGFRPTEAELAWARAALASGDGAASVLGAMVDAPVRLRAHALLNLAIKDN